MAFPEGGDAAPDSVSSLDDDDLHAERLELLRRGQTGNAGPDDEHLSRRFWQRQCPFVDAEVDVAVSLQKRVNPETKHILASCVYTGVVLLR